MSGYESEHAKFMRQWLEQHPEELRVIKEGRALWWDKTPAELEDGQERKVGEVPRKAYYYDAN
ncbi:DUF3460 family protein [Denitratisoma oestradiolicum]|uniref:DUF3460 domain-containing protein n=1 Tax=Denitratisoma oestradiolicum TaxID=311182 RepID=A0A6S6Y5E1_9PROT|nr:DUF3460 family protein [Denitratisoma oestradiolicum]TWO81682.1 DUF3460 domain-containing protein [Denitratisoma oestradiolicum]CAB1370630.1 conserved protein of unknown function [Denitratisoma oestradiolicum]